LFFDDLGSAHFTAARISHFFALMDARYKEAGQTMFTTNHGVKEIRAMLSGNGGKDDTTMADRILRRMIGTANDPRAAFFEFKRRKKATKKEAAPVC
jgi:DNA replication protein DnaC